MFELLEYNSIIERLNNGDSADRKSALIQIAGFIENQKISRTANEEVNNHVHTNYSFSPYSPSGAALAAWKDGLQAVGLMDHDSISGAEEMLEACKVMDIASTIGFEIRVNFSGTSVEGLRTNNPDSHNISYITVQGVPADKFKEAEKFLEPVKAERNIRNRKEVDNLNKLISVQGIEKIDFEKDVLGRSMSAFGGSVTERHILAALSEKLISKFGKGEPVVKFLENKFNIPLSSMIKEFLLDKNNPHYLYDLLGTMKGDFLLEFFIQPNEAECLPVKKVVDFANSIGAIPAYSYLGDVAESPTGDKKAQAFEDSFLDKLMDEVKKIGFKAVTYMPPRNTRSQLDRIQSLCKKHNFMEISGVDINSSRQIFNCPPILEEKNRHLIDSTWALIAHEKLTGKDKYLSLFSKKNPMANFPLHERISFYNKIGRDIDKKNPENLDNLIKKVYEYGN
ncbi:MAG: PHP domain-containing protein [Spirochaetales bacterium]|nr:PHP domain-containing protein [Spirochaetales bacterium]